MRAILTAASVSVLVLGILSGTHDHAAARPAGDPGAPQAGQPAGVPLSAVAPDDKPLVERAEKAMAALSSRLIARLSAALKAGGASGAVTVCRDEAPGIAEAVTRETGVTVGRTSHRLRNPKSAAPAWASTLVEAGAGKSASAVEPRLFDLGSRIAVIKPIGTVDLCTRCHGAAESIEPAVRQTLSNAYPRDRATGFKAGDLRGWIWAEVPRTAK